MPEETTPPQPPVPSNAFAYGAPLPPRRRSAAFWLLVVGGSLVMVVLLICGTVWSTVQSLKADDSEENGIATSSKKIGVIEVTGVILTADTLSQQMRKMAADSDVKAVILHINSPGGGAAASQELFNEVVRIRKESHKKFIASIESVGASGAYYIASGCDKIYANDASVVGSIGVIMEWTNYGELLRWAKLKNVTLKAGELKDAGDPTRDLTPKEQAYFQTLVDNMHGQFIHDVATGRGTSDDKILPLATGQVWTGQQAIGLHLIDKQGGFRVALMDTARDAGISGEPGIQRPAKTKHGILSTLISGDADNLFPNPSKLLDQAPGFYYMWR
jgi:protease IV